ncbi:MAG: MGMT family protein [Candidatus Eisenbacteria bacterium]|nr:MGMT family protein [Candidatus Eisenbacteria bacterium]
MGKRSGARGGGGRGARGRSDLYERIYAAARRVPRGRVTTYGRIAALVGCPSPRVVGYAMAAATPDIDVPWQRVINARGEVSARRGGYGAEVQRALLEEEGVLFDDRGRVDLARFGWP